MAVAVELNFETDEHVVGRSDAGRSGGLGRPDRAVTGATQEHHRPIIAGWNVLQQVGHEVPIGRAVGRVPFDVDDIAAQAGQVGHADEAPFGVGANEMRLLGDGRSGLHHAQSRDRGQARQSRSTREHH